MIFPLEIIEKIVILTDDYIVADALQYILSKSIYDRVDKNWIKVCSLCQRKTYNINKICNRHNNDYEWYKTIRVNWQKNLTKAEMRTFCTKVGLYSGKKRLQGELWHSIKDYFEM
jgi:hypothetical protein